MSYEQKNIVIIGGGFTGTLTALNLIRLNKKIKINLSLIEGTNEFGLGIAYSPPSENFKLNVKASAMGAWADAPEDFYRWLQESGFKIEPTAFAPRQWYGNYIKELLQNEIKNLNTNLANFNLIRDTALDIEQNDSELKVVLQKSGPIYADSVVLALGNIPRDPPYLKNSVPILKDAYNGETYTSIDSAQSIFILGSSLTAIDFVLEAERLGFKGNYTMLSRNGLLPLPYEETTHQFIMPVTWEKMKGLSNIFKEFVKLSKEYGTSQPIMESIRPYLQKFWESFTNSEKATFLRHIRPYWDIHRHRIPKSHWDTLERLTVENRLTRISGRLENVVQSSQSKIKVTYKDKKQNYKIVEGDYNLGILSIGPESNVNKCSMPLVKNLINRKLISCGALGLGIIKIHAPNIINIGPLQRENLWEITAVRELREEALKTAKLLLQD